MDSDSPLPDIISDNLPLNISSIDSLPPITTYQTTDDISLDAVSTPIKNDAFLIEAIDEVYTKIFQQPQEMEEDDDDDNTPLVNLWSKVL